MTRPVKQNTTKIIVQVVGTYPRDGS